MDAEIERFKRDINLAEYAATQGYFLDRKESSRNSVMMRHPGTDDKIAIRQNADGHYTYWSVRDERDNGSIIDFVHRRRFGGGPHVNLGRIRQELRPWTGDVRMRPRVQLPDFVHKMEAMTADRPRVLSAFSAAREVETSPYLNGRGIRPETLNDPRFRGVWRVDGRGNVLFPHRDRKGEEGICGYEVKNKGFTGFSPAGIKALWVSAARDTDTRLVLTEAAIDALSYHQLQPDEHTRYASTGGAWSPTQRDLLTRVIQRLPQGSTVVLAQDADRDGDKLARQIQELVPGARFLRHAPPHFHEKVKDWNDVLQRAERDYIRSLGRALGAGRAVGRSSGQQAGLGL